MASRQIAWSTGLALIALLAACAGPSLTADIAFPADDPAYRYVGRVDTAAPREAVLIGGASYVEFAFTGPQAEVYLTATDYGDGWTWAVVDIDGEYRGRHRVEAGDTLALTVYAPPGYSSPFRVRIHQGGEAMFGRLVFLGASARYVLAAPRQPALTLAFFGDSMSNGAASDTSASPCGRGLDNTNAYLAFPARIGRALDADYVVHAIAGRGLYINWNGQDPPLPRELGYLYLDSTDARPYDMRAVHYDGAVVALGTNDLNEEPALRPTFDSARFERAYAQFIDTLHAQQPDMAILLSTSAMVRDTAGARLARILARTANRARLRYPTLHIDYVRLPDMTLHGCPAGPHPSAEDHAIIAAALAPELQRLMEG